MVIGLVNALVKEVNQTFCSNIIVQKIQVENDHIEKT